MLTGQLDMGKPFLFLKQLQFFFQLQHTLPGFQSGRTGHSAQQCPLIDGFALGPGWFGHALMWVGWRESYRAAGPRLLFFISSQCLRWSAGRAGKMVIIFPKIDITFNLQVYP